MIRGCSSVNTKFLSDTRFLYLMLEATKVKTLRRILVATILSLTLAVSTFAGDVHCPGVASTGTTSDTTTTTDTITTAVLLVVTVVY